MGRARITITDLVYVLLGLAAISGLYPAYMEALGVATPYLSEGEQLMFATLLPFGIIIILATMYMKAATGSR